MRHLHENVYVLPFFSDIILVSLKLHCIRICFSLFFFFLLFFPSWLIQRLNSSKLKLICDVVILWLLSLIREDAFKHGGLKSLPRRYGNWIYFYPFHISQALWLMLWQFDQHIWQGVLYATFVVKFCQFVWHDGSFLWGKSGFCHQINWQPRYNTNIVRGVKQQ